MSESILEESPPASPCPSDTEADLVSRPGSTSDIGELLSDISLPSDEEGRDTTMTPEPPEEELDSGFQDITDSMLGSTIDRSADVKSIHTDSEDGDTTRPLSRKVSLRSTPTASTALLDRGMSKSKSKSGSGDLQDSTQSFHYPDPQEDGSTPFGLSRSIASTMDSSTSTSDSSMMWTPPGGTTPVVRSQSVPMASALSGAAAADRSARIEAISRRAREKAKARLPGSLTTKDGKRDRNKRLHMQGALQTSEIKASTPPSRPKIAFGSSALFGVGFFIAVAATAYHVSQGNHASMKVELDARGSVPPASSVTGFGLNSAAPVAVTTEPVMHVSPSTPTSALAARQFSSDLLVVPTLSEPRSKRRKVEMQAENTAEDNSSLSMRFERLQAPHTAGKSGPLDAVFKAQQLREGTRKRHAQGDGAFARLSSYDLAPVERIAAADSPDDEAAATSLAAGTTAADKASANKVMAEKVSTEADDNEKAVPVLHDEDLFLLPLSGPSSSIQIFPDFRTFKIWVEEAIGIYLRQVYSLGESATQSLATTSANIEASSFKIRKAVVTAVRDEWDRTLQILHDVQRQIRAFARTAGETRKKAIRRARRNRRRLRKFLQRRRGKVRRGITFVQVTR